MDFFKSITLFGNPSIPHQAPADPVKSALQNFSNAIPANPKDEGACAVFEVKCANLASQIYGADQEVKDKIYAAFAEVVYEQKFKLTGLEDIIFSVLDKFCSEPGCKHSDLFFDPVAVKRFADMPGSKAAAYVYSEMLRLGKGALGDESSACFYDQKSAKNNLIPGKLFILAVTAYLGDLDSHLGLVDSFLNGDSGHNIPKNAVLARGYLDEATTLAGGIEKINKLAETYRNQLAEKTMSFAGKFIYTDFGDTLEKALIVNEMAAELGDVAAILWVTSRKADEGDMDAKFTVINMVYQSAKTAEQKERCWVDFVKLANSRNVKAMYMLVNPAWDGVVKPDVDMQILAGIRYLYGKEVVVPEGTKYVINSDIKFGLHLLNACKSNGSGRVAYILGDYYLHSHFGNEGTYARLHYLELANKYFDEAALYGEKESADLGRKRLSFIKNDPGLSQTSDEQLLFELSEARLTFANKLQSDCNESSLPVYLKKFNEELYASLFSSAKTDLAGIAHSKQEMKPETWLSLAKMYDNYLILSASPVNPELEEAQLAKNAGSQLKPLKLDDLCLESTNPEEDAARCRKNAHNLAVALSGDHNLASEERQKYMIMATQLGSLATEYDDGNKGGIN